MPVKQVGTISKVVNSGMKGLRTPGLRVGAVAGAGTFFGLEWLTNGGMTNAVAGTFGISEGLASVLMLGGLFVIGGLALWAFLRRNKRSTKRKR
jgi:hypothetical protein